MSAIKHRVQDKLTSDEDEFLLWMLNQKSRDVPIHCSFEAFQSAYVQGIVLLSRNELIVLCDSFQVVHDLLLSVVLGCLRFRLVLKKSQSSMYQSQICSNR